MCKYTVLAEKGIKSKNIFIVKMKSVFHNYGYVWDFKINQN